MDAPTGGRLPAAPIDAAAQTAEFRMFGGLGPRIGAQQGETGKPASTAAASCPGNTGHGTYP
jgi:hypothetical protein